LAFVITNPINKMSILTKLQEIWKKIIEKRKKSQEKKRIVRDMVTEFKKMSLLISNLTINEIGRGNNWSIEAVKRKSAWLKFIFKKSREEIMDLNILLYAQYGIKTASAFKEKNKRHAQYDETIEKMEEFFRDFTFDEANFSKNEEIINQLKESFISLYKEETHTDEKDTSNTTFHQFDEFTFCYDSTDPDDNICSEVNFQKAKRLVLLYSFLQKSYNIEDFLKQRDIHELYVLDDYIGIAYSSLFFLSKFHVGNNSN
jgi:hypothetical protein